ncbi:MAG: hypothetical protein HN377_14220, partial [Alphaproteobacteria bacterium]|nr:hypothetical protein [Alphaproteobacteria bacterium]
SAPDAVRLEGEVLITELSGSESVIHFNLQGQTWVSQSQGIHSFKVGASTELFADVSHCLYFGANNQLVAHRSPQAHLPGQGE